MFIRCYLELDRPCDALAALLREEETGEWLVALVQENARWEGELLSRVGFGPGRQRVERRDRVTVAPPVPFGGGLLLLLSWRSREPRPLPGRVEADLQVVPMGPGLTQISINARYESLPSGSGVGLERRLQHRIAETVIGDLLRRVASTLSARLEERTGT